MDKFNQTLQLEIFAKYPSRKAQQTITDILTGAIAAYSKYGIDQTTYAKIAQEAGVSRPLVIHYFPEYQDLFLNCIQYIRFQMQHFVIGEMKSTEAPEQLLQEYIAASIRWAQVYQQQAQLWLLYYFKCATQKDYKDLNTKIVQVGTQRIVGLCKGINSKLSAAQSKLIAKQIQNLITGSIVSSVSENLDGKALSKNVIKYSLVLIKNAF